MPSARNSGTTKRSDKRIVLHTQAPQWVPFHESIWQNSQFRATVSARAYRAETVASRFRRTRHGHRHHGRLRNLPDAGRSGAPAGTALADIRRLAARRPARLLRRVVLRGAGNAISESRREVG